MTSVPGNAHVAKEGRDMSQILSLTRNPIFTFAARRQEEDKHEAEEVEKENPATRKTLARGARETGRIKTQTAAGRIGKSVESGKEIGCSSYCLSREEVSEEAEKKAESFTGTSCATLSGYEGPMGGKKSGRWQ
jgi:hypothetical protein